MYLDLSRVDVDPLTSMGVDLAMEGARPTPSSWFESNDLSSSWSWLIQRSGGGGFSFSRVGPVSPFMYGLLRSSAAAAARDPRRHITRPNMTATITITPPVANMAYCTTGGIPPWTWAPLPPPTPKPPFRVLNMTTGLCGP